MPPSDAAFIIGKTHKVCQDYALASDDALYPSVWLSDGCSSSPHTDIGARLLVHKSLDRVSDFVSDQETGDGQQDDWMTANLAALAPVVGTLGITPDCLNTTLLGLVCDATHGSERRLHAVLYGDGAVVYGLTNGERVVYRSSYPANFPFYPAYLSDTKRRRVWEGVPDNRQIITRTVLDANGRVQEQETSCPGETCHIMTRPVAGLRWTAILSDGIESFQQRGQEESSCSFVPVDSLDVIRHLTAFKNFTGGFVHRRLQSFGKECVRRGWHHNDDVSIAALYLGEED